jgi:hypothetical protein
VSAGTDAAIQIDHPVLMGLGASPDPMSREEAKHEEPHPQDSHDPPPHSQPQLVIPSNEQRGKNHEEAHPQDPPPHPQSQLVTNHHSLRPQLLR